MISGSAFRTYWALPDRQRQPDCSAPSLYLSWPQTRMGSLQWVRLNDEKLHSHSNGCETRVAHQNCSSILWHGQFPTVRSQATAWTNYCQSELTTIPERLLNQENTFNKKRLIFTSNCKFQLASLWISTDLAIKLSWSSFKLFYNMPEFCKDKKSQLNIAKKDGVIFHRQ